jgi:hypothetical protein
MKYDDHTFLWIMTGLALGVILALFLPTTPTIKRLWRRINRRAHKNMMDIGKGDKK